MHFLERLRSSMYNSLVNCMRWCMASRCATTLPWMVFSTARPISNSCSRRREATTISSRPRKQRRRAWRLRLQQRQRRTRPGRGPRARGGRRRRDAPGGHPMALHHLRPQEQARGRGESLRLTPPSPSPPLSSRRSPADEHLARARALASFLSYPAMLARGHVRLF